jgi:hypothetical protein
MPVATLFSVIESPAHPNFTSLYKRLKINEVKFNSIRKVMAQLKKQQPDFVVAEFSYGSSSKYAGVNISNLDVLIASLRKFAPHTRPVVMVDKAEQRYVGELAELFPLYAILQLPVREQEIEALLTRT